MFSWAFEDLDGHLWGVGLSVWGISEAKAKKLISRPLDKSSGK